MCCLAGCSSKNSRQILSQKEKKLTNWLISDSDGELFQFDDFSFLMECESPMTPWTAALRITDITNKGSSVAALVNQSGISLFDISDNGSISINKITDAESQKFTTGHFQLADTDLLLYHIYTDTFFGDSPAPPKSPFMGLKIGENSVSYINHNFPAAVKDFSLINLKKVDGKWLSAWKNIKNNGVSFKYFIHTTPLGENIDEISETRFMVANQLFEKSDFPQKFKQDVAAIINTEKDFNFIDIEFRAEGAPQTEKYMFSASSLENAEHYKKLCITAALNKNSKEYNDFFVSYDGLIYFINNDSANLIPSLEKLPDNYEYTALYVIGGKLFAAWEEQLIFLTGFSGISILDL